VAQREGGTQLNFKGYILSKVQTLTISYKNSFIKMIALLYTGTATEGLCAKMAYSTPRM